MITIAVVILLCVWYRKIPVSKRFRLLNVVVILFIAGALGNLIDRIVNNYVVDFFYFSLINFPIFNVADIYVTVAAFMFIILGLFYYKEEDFSLIFPDKSMKIDKENKKRESFTMNRDTFEVQSEQEGERLDKYLSSIYPDISRSFFNGY